MDKFLHFVICLVLSLYSTELAVGPAVTKEWCDNRVYGNKWDWYDFMCDVIGIVMGTMIRILLIDRYNWI